MIIVANDDNDDDDDDADEDDDENLMVMMVVVVMPITGHTILISLCLSCLLLWSCYAYSYKNINYIVLIIMIIWCRLCLVL